jgi:hypothetical protein
MGSANAQRVQSLLVRVSDGGLQAGRITFSEGVSIVGLVSDLEGEGGVYVWGARPNRGVPASQLATARGIFGVGMDYLAREYWAYDVAGTSTRKDDSFSLDRESREVTFSAFAPLVNTCDDFRIVISYNEDSSPNESFDVVLTEGSGLDVGAIHVGDGEEFYGVPLTVSEPSTLGLAGMGIAVGLIGWHRRRKA